MAPTIMLSEEVRADPERACDILRDWRCWPRTFPSTIAAVNLIERSNKSITLQILHRTEGPVINILNPDECGAVRLREFKPRYDAEFTFFSMPAQAGSTLHVHGSIWLKGPLAWLGCLLAPLIRRRMRRYLLEPLRVRAERHQPQDANRPNIGETP